MRHLSDDDDARPGEPTTLGRRDLIKLGAGGIAAALMGERATAEEGEAAPQIPPGSPPPAAKWRPHTGPGYKNDANRLGGNGPMDDTTRKIVKYVKDFKESDMTPAVIKAANRTMVDSMACIFSGFEEEAVRVAARAARLSPGGPLKSTVLGYGITSTPEVAAFANACALHCVDFADVPHYSDLIPAVLAVGEAKHATGSQVMAAVVLGYEIASLSGQIRPSGPSVGWYEHEQYYSGFSMGEAVPAAMAVGKLMGLDEDRLANALTIALTPHVALNKGVGAMSMWKGCRSAEAVKCGVWAAFLAQLGMTGPPQPFEGVGGLWYRQGGVSKEFTVPARSQPAIVWGSDGKGMLNKKFPSDGLSQECIRLLPAIRAWTKHDEIASIDYYLQFLDWEENGDAPKWDPRNRETADHSLPYVLARGIISGEIYLDSYALDKFPYRDPVVKELMDKINLWPVAEWRGIDTGSIVIRKKSGEEKAFDTHHGARDEDQFPPMTDEEITEKFKRVCDYKHMAAAQRDKALAQWWNLSAVTDIAEPMRTLANYGKPVAL